MPNKDQIVRVEFSLKIPETCTDEQLKEWLEFELNANGSMKFSPLFDSDLEAQWGSVRWQ